MKKVNNTQMQENPKLLQRIIYNVRFLTKHRWTYKERGDSDTNSGKLKISKYKLTQSRRRYCI